MFKHLLVPIDGGDASQAAVLRSVKFAREAGAIVTFYNARQSHLPAVIAGEGVIIDVTTQEAVARAREEESQQILAAASAVAMAAGVRCDTISDIHDAPWEGIIAAAERSGADLIFMASHGRRGVRALLLGSETQKVLTHCKVPVLVFR